MQDKALRPRTKLCRLVGGAAVAGDPPVTSRPQPAVARGRVCRSKGLGWEEAEKKDRRRGDKEMG